MWLKVLIVLLFVATLISLSSALMFLLKDFGNERKRTLYALGIRVTLAVLLVACIVYGYTTGILTNTAPWAGQY